jgi:Concanavalin A-like lectin/glucanases superfamily
MRRFRLATRVAVAITIFACSLARVATAQVTWDIDNTTNIGGNAVTTVVGSPTMVVTPFGNGLQFDGNDGIIVNTDPVAGAAQFTIEMLFRPDPIGGVTALNQPRVLHLQSNSPFDDRATLETRVVGNNWYLDAFLRSRSPGQSDPKVVNSLPLSDETILHPLGEWYNFAMTYDGTSLRAYINGQLDLPAGALSVQPMTSGVTSLGMRANMVNFFKGVIAKVRFTPSLVDPEDFLLSYVPGDFDRNGMVESADYDKWKADFGSSVGQAGEGADGNRDGVVNAADYTVWRDALPEGAAALAERNVPEPATMWLLIIGSLVFARRSSIGERRSSN